MPKDPYLTYEDMAGYFNPPLTYRTLYDWLKKGRVRIFRTPGASPFAGNKICRVRRSIWEKFLRDNEKQSGKSLAKK